MKSLADYNFKPNLSFPPVPAFIGPSVRGALLAGMLLCVAVSSPATAAETTETTTTTIQGTISEFGPERLIIKSESFADPIRYTYSKSTTYVDETGAPVSIQTVKSGLPVTVYYANEGDTRVATKVVVRKSTADPAVPGETTETTTTTTAGTISEFGPERLIIKTESSPEPVRYTYSKTTTYVDETGAPVSIKTVKSGLPVTVYYRTAGDSRVATKVVVRKSTAAPAVPGETTETTTTTTAGTISEFGPERLIIKTEAAPEPIRYTYSKTTTYVDEAGSPVSIKTVKSGLPVTVYYTTVGDSRVATKVVVRKARTAPAAPRETTVKKVQVVPTPPPLVEEKKTTTTTTTEK